jgi:uncharacterized membrane protein
MLDLIALSWFGIAWFGYQWYSVRLSRKIPSIFTVMGRYRHEWMRRMTTRDNRMVDATLIGNLMRSISFFASTSILIIAGLMNILRFEEQAQHMLAAVPLTMEINEQGWGVRVLLLIVIFTYSFFKYTWSLRQYNYAGILVGAAPDPAGDGSVHELFARRTGKLISNAGRHFNLGLRAYYFGLATISWFLHPLLFMVATLWVVFVLYRREFRSNVLRVLMDPEEKG